MPRGGNLQLRGIAQCLLRRSEQDFHALGRGLTVHSPVCGRVLSGVEGQDYLLRFAGGMIALVLLRFVNGQIEIGTWSYNIPQDIEAQGDDVAFVQSIWSYHQLTGAGPQRCVRVSGCGHLHVQECSFAWVIFGESGGAMAIESTESFYIWWTCFAELETQLEDGAWSCDGAVFYDVEDLTEMSQCRFTRCFARKGGAMYQQGAGFTEMSEENFTDCRCGSVGGSLYIETGEGSMYYCVMERCFTNCQECQGAGGVLAKAQGPWIAESSFFLDLECLILYGPDGGMGFEGCSFRDCTANPLFYCGSTTIVLSNCLFVGATAPDLMSQLWIVRSAFRTLKRRMPARRSAPSGPTHPGRLYAPQVQRRGRVGRGVRRRVVARRRVRRRVRR
jgi:hypothetical protein